MAKGKEALAAERSRLAAAHDHIDRLTDQLADAKRRARDAEMRAARFEGIERTVSEATVKHDQMLSDALEKLKWWDKVAKEDRQRRHVALNELGQVLRRDLDLVGVITTQADWTQFLLTRYPSIMMALSAGDSVKWDPAEAYPSSRHRQFERRLSPEQRKRFQRIVGERAIFEGIKDGDVGKIWADLFDAKQVGFSRDEIIDYMGVDRTVLDSA